MPPQYPNVCSIKERSILLVSGPFDGLTLRVVICAEVLWVYKSLYGNVIAVRAGAINWTDSMAA
jgi:hypothetical protein